MISPPAEFAHPLLRAATPASWVGQACLLSDLLLIDHANCEKKAASTALSLMFAYAEDLDLAARMSRLAREELRHYEQVAKLMSALKGGGGPLLIEPGDLRPAPFILAGGAHSAGADRHQGSRDQQCRADQHQLSHDPSFRSRGQGIPAPMSRNMRVP